MKRTMTKREAVAAFEDAFTHSQHQDAVAKRCAFNDYVDSLNKDGSITDHQANTWRNPYDKSRKG